MKARYLILALAMSLCILLGRQSLAPSAEDQKSSGSISGTIGEALDQKPGSLSGTLEAVDIEKRTATIGIPHRIVGEPLFSASIPQTHSLSKDVKVTLGGVGAKLSDAKKVSREAQEPIPGCGCRHGVKAVLKLADDGKTVTEINVLEATSGLDAVDVKKETITLTLPDYLREPIQIGAAEAGQLKMILCFAKPQTYSVGKEAKITMDEKAIQLSDLQKVSKAAGKPDPKCGCLPPGATVTVVLSDDGKLVTDINVHPKPKTDPKKEVNQGKPGGLSTKK